MQIQTINIILGALVAPFFVFVLSLQSFHLDLYTAAQLYHELGEFDYCATLLKRVYPDGKPHTTDLLQLHALRTFRWQDAEQYGLQKLWWYDYPIQDKKIFIKHDGGIGDAVQFLRYAKHLHNAGAYVIIETPDALSALYTHCPYIDKQVPQGSFIEADITITISTPLLTLIMSDTLLHPSTDVPYIYADQRLYNYWHAKLDHIKKPKIGICWCSSPLYNKSTGEKLLSPRSIPLAMLTSLFQRDNCVFISLQSGFGTEQLEQVRTPVIQYPNIDTIHGRFMDTIAIMQNLDLIITVDTSIAHIAGALGVPVWTILPACSDFRWFTTRTDSPWYPTMRLFRQNPYEDWTPVINQVIQALEQFLVNKCE